MRLISVCFKSNSNVIKKMNRELKIMFGGLRETKLEKLKRLKLEETGKISVDKQQSKKDSERHHGILKGPNIRIIKIKSVDDTNKIRLSSNYKNFSYKTIQIRDFKKDAKEKKLNIDEITVKHSNKQSNENNNENNTNDKNDKDNNTMKKVNNFVNECGRSSGNYSSVEITETCSNNDKVIRENNILYENILMMPLFCKAKRLSKIEESTEVLSFSGRNCKEYAKYPSVTKILNETMSEEAKAFLDRWEKKMIIKLGIEGFQLYRQELLQDGKRLHAAIQNSLLHKPSDIHENIEQAFKSVNNVLRDVSDVKAMESHVVHPQLNYRGYLDCVVSYRGKLCVVDWKKSDKQKSSIISTYDAPLQVASYIGALNADKNYPFEIRHGLIVVAYTNGKEATVHEISGDLLQLYWKSWLERLQKYRRNSSDDDTAGAEIKSHP